MNPHNSYTDVPHTVAEPCEDCGNDLFACPRASVAVCTECGRKYRD